VTHRAVPDAAPITDPVTGALVRGALQSELVDAVESAVRAGGSCSLFLFDVDHFKTVNDAYGHARGDAVLRLIAERTTDLVRRRDVLFRYGGDEFVLILPGAGRVEAMRLASRLVEGVARKPLPGTPPLSISISVGVATFPDDATSIDKLLEVADRRNYEAKRRGRRRAVGDDVSVSDAAPVGRLLERDAALRAVQHFLVRLESEPPRALHVTGPPGAGHSQFLVQVANLARMRGFEVRRVGDRPSNGAGRRPSASPPARTLVLADTDAGWEALDKLVNELV
jgi:diguanylate cyclase (GGDEF)-like protein